MTKTDLKQENIFLKGAEYTIYDSQSKIIKVLTTGDDGKLLTKLPPEQYIIAETKAPDGYTIDDEKYILEIRSDSENIEVNFTNEKKESIDADLPTEENTPEDDNNNEDDLDGS